MQADFLYCTVQRSPAIYGQGPNKLLNNFNLTNKVYAELYVPIDITNRWQRTTFVQMMLFNSSQPLLETEMPQDGIKATLFLKHKRSFC